MVTWYSVLNRHVRSGFVSGTSEPLGLYEGMDVAVGTESGLPKPQDIFLSVISKLWAPSMDRSLVWGGC